MQKRVPGDRRGKRKGLRIFGLISAIFAGLLLTGYLLFVFCPLPTIAYWRTIWIETAMTTADHQWLATAFIPKNIIDAVMQNTESTVDVIGGGSYLRPTENTSESEDTKNTSDTTAPSQEEKPPADPDDILGQKHLKVGDTDMAGNIITVNDIEQGLLVSEVVGDGFRGLVMQVDDPARVYLAQTPYPDEKGIRIREMLSTYDAIAGINASGFADPGGEGNGGQVIGLSCTDGKLWGYYVKEFASIVLTEDNRLVVGNIPDWDAYNIRSGMQFGPVLIADGEIKMTGSAGYGLQPRTAIGQREDGVIIFAIIDGRNPTWSLGCTVGDLAQIMADYGAVNAGCCDGGSSSVLAYDGAVLNKNSSLNPDYGRMLPNAFLVKKK